MNEGNVFTKLSQLYRQLGTFDGTINKSDLLDFGGRIFTSIMRLFAESVNDLNAVQDGNEHARARSIFQQCFAMFHSSLGRIGAGRYLQIYNAPQNEERLIIETFHSTILFNHNQAQQSAFPSAPPLNFIEGEGSDSDDSNDELHENHNEELLPDEPNTNTSSGSILERIKQFFIGYFQLPEEYKNKNKFMQFLYRFVKAIQLPFVGVEYLLRNSLSAIFMSIRHPSLIFSPFSYNSVMDADENLNPLQRIIKEIGIGVDNFVGSMLSITKIGEALLNLKTTIRQLHKAWKKLRRQNSVQGALKKMFLDAPWERIKQTFKEIKADPYRAVRYLTELSLLVGSAYVSTYAVAAMTTSVAPQLVARPLVALPELGANIGAMALATGAAPSIIGSHLVSRSFAIGPRLSANAVVTVLAATVTTPAASNAALQFLWRELEKYNPVDDAEMYGEIESEIKTLKNKLGSKVLQESDAVVVELEATRELLLTELTNYDPVHDADMYKEIVDQIKELEVKLQTLTGTLSEEVSPSLEAFQQSEQDSQRVSYGNHPAYIRFWNEEEPDESTNAEVPDLSQAPSP